MALVNKARPSLLSALLVALVASCGEPSAPSARFKEATAPDVAPPKGGDPIGALPSHVVPGEVAAFKATPSGAGLAKDRDPRGSLPSHVAEGRSDLYAPGGRAGSVARSSAGMDGEGLTTSLRAVAR